MTGDYQLLHDEIKRLKQVLTEQNILTDKLKLHYAKHMQVIDALTTENRKLSKTVEKFSFVKPEELTRREQVWTNIFVAVASCMNSDSEQSKTWADKGLKAFDERFQNDNRL